jgi:DNA mismatch endonuclease (patch repair protein)
MADVVSPEVRSRMMAAIRGTHTKPELIIRRGLHRLGFRFRLYDRKLPGKPDLVFPRWNAVLFVHGCFWHGHECHLYRLPATRTDFWQAKVEQNRRTDERALTALAEAGWRRGVIWECALKGGTRLPIETVLNCCGSWLRSRCPTFEIKGAA